MAEAVDDWLAGLAGSATCDRRNGFYRRHRLIELTVPRTRLFCPTDVLKSYARRAPEIDRVILAGFGLSTRKVGEVLLPLHGLPVSAATVSRVARMPRERFLTGLWRLGFTGEGLEVIRAEGGQGLITALPIVYPDILLQRCRAHKIRNLLGKTGLQTCPQPARARITGRPNTPRSWPACSRISTISSPASATPP